MMNQHCFFVTGTDTDAGKTYVSALLLQGYAALGITALGAKPLAAGAEQAADGSLQSVRVIPVGSQTANPAFDVTPARLVTGIITEQGVFAPDKLSLSISNA